MMMHRLVAPSNYATFEVFLNIIFSSLLLKHMPLTAEVMSSSLEKGAGVLDEDRRTLCF